MYGLFIKSSSSIDTSANFNWIFVGTIYAEVKDYEDNEFDPIGW
jgi:hypothetical protein